MLHFLTNYYNTNFFFKDLRFLIKQNRAQFYNNKIAPLPSSYSNINPRSTQSDLWAVKELLPTTAPRFRCLRDRKARVEKNKIRGVISVFVLVKGTCGREGGVGLTDGRSWSTVAGLNEGSNENTHGRDRAAVSRCRFSCRWNELRIDRRRTARDWSRCMFLAFTTATPCAACENYESRWLPSGGGLRPYFPMSYLTSRSVRLQKEICRSRGKLSVYLIREKSNLTFIINYSINICAEIYFDGRREKSR